MPPVKNPCVMTSYGGIIRIRLKGRSLITSSQPANTSSPVFISFNIIHLLSQKYKQFSEKDKRLKFYVICKLAQRFLHHPVSFLKLLIKISCRIILFHIKCLQNQHTALLIPGFIPGGL